MEYWQAPKAQKYPVKNLIMKLDIINIQSGGIDMVNLMRNAKWFVSILAAATLVACSNGGDSSISGDSSDTNKSKAGSGTLSVNITDAPIDNVTSIIISFSAVHVRQAGGEGSWLRYELDPVREIDLLTLTGPISEPLLADVGIPAGTYDEIRLIVEDGSSPGGDFYATYLVTSEGATEPLFVPSGASSGLKLKNPFVITAGGSTALTIDMDLSKSVLRTGAGAYHLKPVLRVVDNMQYGHIGGSIEAVNIEESCTREDSKPKVYLYATGEEPVEMSENSSAIATSPVTLNEETGMFDYSIGFVESGEYVLALTCDGDRDEPLTEENTEDETLVSFIETANIIVEQGATVAAQFDFSTEEIVDGETVEFTEVSAP